MRKIFLLLIFAFSLFSLFSFHALANWKIENEYIPGAREGSLVSQLTFSNKEKKFTYSPKSRAFGFVESESKVLGNRNLILTIWAHGVRSVILRVFEPEKANTPICEVVSQSDKSDLRIVDNHLQLSIAQENMHEHKWVECK